MIVTDQYYFCDAFHQNAPMPGYPVVALHTSYRTCRRCDL